MDIYTAVNELRNNPNGVTREHEGLSGAFSGETWVPSQFRTTLLFLEKEKHFVLIFNKPGSSRYHCARKITYRQVLRYLRRFYNGV
jgi:hypothetical protein